MQPIGRTGHKDYATIMRALWTGPKTIPELAQAIGRKPLSVSKVMRAMWSQRLVHISAWSLNVARYAPIWGAGDKTDATLPPGVDGRITPLVRSEVVSFANFWRCLVDGASVAEIAHDTGLCNGTIYQLIRHCRELSIVRIKGWRRPPRDMGDHIAVFGLGTTKDAPRPPATPTPELNRRAWARRKQKLAAIRLSSVFSMAANVSSAGRLG